MHFIGVILGLAVTVAGLCIGMGAMAGVVLTLIGEPVPVPFLQVISMFCIGVLLGTVGILAIIHCMKKIEITGRILFRTLILAPMCLFLGWSGLGLVGTFRHVPILDPFNFFEHASTTWVGYLLILVGFLGTGLALFGKIHHPNSTYDLTDTRADVFD